MDNIIEIPKGNYGTEFVGPFVEEHRVVCSGYSVPYITAIDRGDSVDLICDHRLGMPTVPKSEAEKWMPFIANCMAVAAGYSCHGEGSIKNQNPFKVGVVGL